MKKEIKEHSDYMKSFLGKEVLLSDDDNTVVGKGIVDEVRFAEGGTITTTAKNGNNYLLFETKINGKWYGRYNSEVLA